MNVPTALITPSTRSSWPSIWKYSPSVRWDGCACWRPTRYSRRTTVSRSTCVKAYRCPSGSRCGQRRVNSLRLGKELPVLVLLKFCFSPQVWMSVGGAQKLKDNHSPNLYRQLLNKPIDDDIRNIIKVDVPRTFPDNIYFQPASENQSALIRILYAFAAHNPLVGYCQVRLSQLSYCCSLAKLSICFLNWRIIVK